MIKLIFTIDYEIHGNGDGCPLKLMVEPTNRLMNLMDSYGARVTIFADMAEIGKFKEYYETTGNDKFHYLKIKAQLEQAVMRGHDVQLHIHSSFFNAVYDGKKWQNSWEEYNLSGLSYETIYVRIKSCKELLESIIREKVPGYRCRVFRAANWAMQPTYNIAKAMLDNRIYIDSSVYKYGKQSSWVNYDYTSAYQQTVPYKASINDICINDPQSLLWEFPIHCELRPFWHFVSPIRILRIFRANLHKHKAYPEITPLKHQPPFGSETRQSIFKKIFPRKFDFNQLSAGQMIRQLKTIKSIPGIHPYVTLIGHSKSFVRYNEYTLSSFLKYISKQSNEYTFSSFPSSNEL